VVGPVGEDLDGGEAPHPDPLWMGHLRGKRLRQRVVRERGHGDRDRDRDSRTRRRGRGHDGVGIEKIHGVVLVLQQFVEHLSFISFRRRLGIRREPVKVDGTVIVRMGWRWGDVHSGHGRSVIGVVRERVLRRRDGRKGAKVRVCRALRRLVRTRGGGPSAATRVGMAGGVVGQKSVANRSMTVRTRAATPAWTTAEAWTGVVLERGQGARSTRDDLQRGVNKRGVGQRETYMVVGVLPTPTRHAHVACNDTLSIDG
jgi:hypothetical protein